MSSKRNRATSETQNDLKHTKTTNKETKQDLQNSTDQRDAEMNTKRLQRQLQKD